MEIGKERLVGDLKRMGIEEGDCLGLGVSLKSIGYVQGGPNTLIDALMESVGDDGTIFFPAHSRGFRLCILKPGKQISTRDGSTLRPWNYIYEPSATPPITGLVPTTLWKRDGSYRSRHPINSIVALGKDAYYLTKRHDEMAPPFSPYSTLVDMVGKVLFIGLDGRLVSIRHEAQHLAGLTDNFPDIMGVRYRRKNGSIGLYKRGPSGCTRRLSELNEELFQRGLLSRGKLGEADCSIGKAKEILQCLSNRLRLNPEKVLCGNPRCLWCRYLEDKYDLLEKIDGKKPFQKSRVTRTVTALLNNLRLRNWYWAERVMSLYSRILYFSGMTN